MPARSLLSIAAGCLLVGILISHSPVRAANPAAASQSLPGLRRLMDTPLRDPCICQGPDGTWYLTGTVEPFWSYNEGIKIWKSKDRVTWEPMGFVWKYGQSPWHEPYLKAKKPLWAPEIHYLKNTFWLTYSLPGWDGTAKTSGCGLLKSSTGRPEGPYQDVQPSARLGDEIDASLFEDDDGTVYFLWHSGKIARMKPDMSGLAEPYHWLRTVQSDPDPRHHSGLCTGIFGANSFDHVGYEGMFLFKNDGLYYLACSEEFDGRYSCAVATANDIYGPYSARSEALPHAGHNMFFRDQSGQWWSTFFGSDKTAPWQERPGEFPIHFAPAGRVRPGLGAPAPWHVGTPIVTYWAGPPMNEAAARQMAAGGWNLVWCTEKELDLVQRFGLRAQLQDGLLQPATLDDPARRQQLDALIERVRHHPALYDYFITDEPSASQFAGLGRLVAYLRQRDPAHLAYINLFPTYANNEQLGTKGDLVTAYHAHLREYLQTVRPGLISYDHYQFTSHGDTDQYFLNLAMIRQAADRVGVPFLNIVQACSWSPSMRVPEPNEMRYLVYTTLAYGAEGISYFVYTQQPGMTGGITLTNGAPTALYTALGPLNRDFVAIAQQLQPLQLRAVYSAGNHPRGTEPLPAIAPFLLDPPIADLESHPRDPVKGVLLGCFAPPGTTAPTHVVIVNLDYTAEHKIGLRGPGPLARFDPATGKWQQLGSSRAELTLPPGGGALLANRPVKE